MPPDSDQLTLALVLTAAGATVAAGLITGLIEMLKRLPGLGTAIDNGKEPAVAFLLSAVLVVIAYVGTLNGEAPTVVSGFAAFLAFYGIASLSMQVHDQVSDATGGSSPVTGGGGGN